MIIIILSLKYPGASKKMTVRAYLLRTDKSLAVEKYNEAPRAESPRFLGAKY